MSPTKLKSIRATLKCSQFKLSKQSGVSRFKISQFEQDYGTLFPLEIKRIEKALVALK